jgi:hypothetical protein
MACGSLHCNDPTVLFRGAWRGQTMDAFHFFTKLDQTLLLGARASSIDG